MAENDLNNIRVKEHLGIVTSDTNTTHFSFYLSLFKNRIEVGKDDYVLVDHPIYGSVCPLLAVLKEIKSYEEIVGTTSLGDKSVRLMALGEILGYLDLRNPNRLLQKLSMPPDPGSKVYQPYAEFLEDIFQRDLEGKPIKNALHLGRVGSNPIGRDGNPKPLNFYFDPQGQIKRHILITGMSGVGKTHTASVIVEELSNKTGDPVVIFDPYGEYNTIGVASEWFSKLAQDGGVSPKDYPFSFKVKIYAPDPDGVQHNFEGSGFKLEDNPRYSVQKTPERWASSTNEQAKKADKDEFKQAVSHDQITIFNSVGLSSEEKSSFYTFCAKTLWNNRIDGGVEPFLLVVERPEDIDADALLALAGDGRRYGVSLGLLSQHPAKVDSGILSQMGTQLMGRTTDAGDLDRLKGMAGEDVGLLPKLRPGEWIVNGIELARPTKVFIRERYSQLPVI